MTTIFDDPREAIKANLRPLVAKLLDALNEDKKVVVLSDVAVVHGEDFKAFLRPDSAGKLTITHYDLAAWAEQVQSAFRDDFELIDLEKADGETSAHA